jgi:phage FluMu gp28-like protein
VSADVGQLSRVLLGYQGRWLASGLAGGWSLRVAEKSRRVGITWAEALRQVLVAMRVANDRGCDSFYVSTSQLLAREYVETAATWAEALERLYPGRVLARQGKAVQADKIVFASGHTLEGLTSRPAALRGRGGDVVIDEAAHHPALPELLKAAFAVGLWVISGLTLISTHNGSENPFAQVVEEVRTGRRRGVLMTIDLESAVAEGLYKRICAVTRVEWSEQLEDAWVAERFAEDGADEEYKCIPARDGIVYFRRDLLDVAASIEWVVVHWKPGDAHALIDEEERKAIALQWCEVVLGPLLAGLNCRQTHTIGSDFARSCNGDLSTFAVMAERQDLARAVPILVELRGVPFEDQWVICRYLIDGLGSSFGGIGLDGQGNGAWLAEKAQSYVGTMAVISNGDKTFRATHYPRVRSDLEERRLSIPADADLLADFGMIRLKEGTPHVPPARSKSKRDGGLRHADGCVAIVNAAAAAVEAVRLDGLGGDSDGDEEVFISSRRRRERSDVFPRGGRGFKT